MNNLKLIAIYLPQYHETEYNSRWWGKGFTDWTAVKKALPCFDDHKQPKIPLGYDYYDLLDKKTFQNQEKLMKKYGIYGFCFYHYYFKDGARVLEKPVENLLQWKDIDIPYCLNWASKSWIRTWSNFYGDVWGEKFDKDVERGGEGILIEQNFGSRKEWKEHFDYLLQFFRDERYIKIDGKPVFIFHNAEQIPCIEKMTKYWADLAKEEGLKGLYFIGANVSGYREELDAVLISEPTYTRKKLLEKNLYSVKNGVTCFKYSDFVEEMLNNQCLIGIKTYFCGVPGYDTTPRRGYNGECLLDNSSELFEVLIDGLYKKSIECGNEYIFINAWNEWGEGMYLEPDEENGYAALESIKKVNAKYEMVEIPSEYSYSYTEEEITGQLKLLNDKINKFRWLYENTIRFASIIQNNSYKIKKYFNKKNIKKISVYGVGPIGKLLINQLIQEGIEIAYTVDIDAARVLESIPMYRLQEEIPQTDILIVTVYGAEEVIEKMRQKEIQNAVSIENWMNDLLS